MPLGNGVCPGELHPGKQHLGSISNPPGDAEQVGRVWRGASGKLGTGYSHEVLRGGNAAVSASPDPKKLLEILQMDMSAAGPNDPEPRAGVGIPAAWFASQ